jgi:hypothetical protein
MFLIKALAPSYLSMIFLHTLAVCSVAYMLDLQSQLNAWLGSHVAGRAAFDREIDDQAAVSVPTTMREPFA